MVLGKVLVTSLVKAGFKAAQLVLMELPDQAAAAVRTTPMKEGWQAHTVTFAGKQDHLRRPSSK